MFLSAPTCAPRQSPSTVPPTTRAAQMFPSNPMLTLPMTSNATQAQTAPQIPETIVVLSASLLPPVAKNVAQAIKPTQMMKMPASGTSANHVATAPRTPMLTDNATKLVMYDTPPCSVFSNRSLDFAGMQPAAPLAAADA